MLEKYLKLSGVVFLLSGSIWFVSGSYTNYTATIGAKRSFDLKISEIQKTVGQQQAGLNQIVGRLRSLKNEQVDEILGVETSK